MAYKVSYYIVKTDLFFDHSKSPIQHQIIFSTRTSSILLISEDVSEKLFNAKHDLIEDEILNELIDGKFLVPEEEDELMTIVQENKRSIEDDSLLYYVIQPTANCQLGCGYCGQSHNKHQISSGLYENLIARVRSKYVKGLHKGMKIGWFGGEPLIGLKQIRELTIKLKELAKELGLSYSAKIVTNGLSLKEGIFLELVKDLNIREIEVTLDGVAEFHDKRRHTKQNESTFNIIFDNLKAILNRADFQDLNCRISIRCNVDKRNWEGVTPLIKLLASEGFHKKIAYFYPIGVYSWGNEAHLGSLTKEEFAEKEIDWLIEQYQAGFSPNFLPGRVKSVCLAVSNSSEMIDAYGNIFNCTEVSYVPNYENSNYVLGNLKFSPPEDKAVRPLSNWNDQILEGKYQCTKCRMLPVCGGACPKSWSEDMRACPPSKFNIEQKLMLSYFTTKEQFTEAINQIEF